MGYSRGGRRDEKCDLIIDTIVFGLTVFSVTLSDRMTFLKVSHLACQRFTPHTHWWCHLSNRLTGLKGCIIMDGINTMLINSSNTWSVNAMRLWAMSKCMISNAHSGSVKLKIPMLKASDNHPLQTIAFISQLHPNEEILIWTVA